MIKNFIGNNIEKIIYQRSIRSFSLRNNKISKNKEKILTENWESIGINYRKKKIDLNNFFEKKNEIIIDIGFGSGSFLTSVAENNKNKNFVGIEVYKPGIVSCILKIIKLNINNLRIIYYDAIDVIKNMILNESISFIQLLFPDPWHKKKHHKRRIIQINFVKIIIKKLKVGGLFYIATDCKKYFEYILNLMKEISNVINESKNKKFHNVKILKKYNQYKTKFEYRSERIGNKNFYLVYKKIKN